MSFRDTRDQEIVETVDLTPISCLEEKENNLIKSEKYIQIFFYFFLSKVLIGLPSYVLGLLSH